MVALTDDGPFVFGVCAFCEAGLAPGPRPSRPRTICDRRECMIEANRYGARIRVARQKREAAARPAKTEQTCSRCRTTYPATTKHFYNGRKRPDGGHDLDRWCRKCRREYQRVGRLSPDVAERRRVKRRERAARALERLRADPVAHEAAKAAWRERARRERQRDPDGFARRQRAYHERVKADPAKLQAKREADRMNYRLRRERAGKPAERTRTEGQREEAPSPMLPARPLGEAVDRLIDRELAAFDCPDAWVDGPTGATRESLALGYGTTDRTLRAWLSGERRSVAMVDADRVMVAADLLPFDIWTDPAVLALWES